ncbi:MAG: STAS domain-containing protein [Phycisphaerales bacterium]|nr:STAS domain-containing protein [Phycisphaerales bacterium]
METSIVTIEREGGAAVGRVMCHQVAAREAQVIQEEMTAAGPGAAHRLVVDFSSVTMLASMGIGMLVSINKVCKEKGGRMAICCLRPELLEVLKLTKLDRFFTITKDRASAVKAVGG